MKKTVVIYESKYGFTKRYAEWIAEALSCPVFEQKKFCTKDFAQYETIIYGGGLYAGGVSGIRLITENWSLLSDKQVVLFTCGLANPGDSYNVSNIRQSLSKILSDDMMKRIRLFHLQGGIDYRRLSFIHKTMMSMLRKMLLKKDEHTLRQEDRLILETYGQNLDFTDKGSIRPLVECVLNL